MDIKSVEQTVSKIQRNLFKNSNSVSIGMLKSHFRGTGLQFKEHQIYAHGDDVRFLDWKLLAKTSTPYIKTFEEERNVEIVVVLDLSLSMFVGHKGISKLQVAIEVCCLLYLLAQQTGDKVHCLLVGEDIYNLPPKSGQEGLALLISQLEKLEVMIDGKVNPTYRPAKHIDERRKYAEVLRHLIRKKEVVLLTDFIDFLSLESIKTISYKNNVHCFRILSPLDKEMAHKFTIWGVDSGDIQFGRKGLFRAKSQGAQEDELTKALGNKLKTLDVQERYLDKFIKEMV